MSAQTHVLPADFSVTATSASATVLAQNMQRNFLLLHNPNSAGTVWVNLVGGTPVVQTAGSIAIVALAAPLVFSTGVPCGAITAITSAGSCPLTVLAG